MRKTRCLSISLLVGCLGVSVATVQGDDLEGVLGGERWDKWWAAAGVPEPTGDHPLYPDIGSKSGSTTWRCKECHGWDYKGVDGAYGSGSHYTGIKGIFGSELTPQEMFDLVKNDDPPYGHGFGNAGLSDDDIAYLVEFMQNYLHDTDLFIDGANEFIGDETLGRYGYQGVGGFYSCTNCHGADGTDINFGTPDDPKYVRDIAVGNPWELMHKVRFGDPNTGAMPSSDMMGRSVQDVADVGKYLQADFPSPSYVGDDSCSGCHADYPREDFFDDYRRSGHPYKLNYVGGQEPPPGTWPFSETPPLPVVYGDQLQWSGVSYIIGNYFWKARFIDLDGFIYTGNADEKTQWNLATQQWSPYHAGETDKPYNCGRCHTTGYQPEGNQNGMPGMIGTWTEDGVRCEACHGPSSDHVTYGSEMLPPGGKDCAECHYRDDDFRMPWKGGFMRHHQQSEDLSHSPHANVLSCNSCHDSHLSTVYQEGGLIAQCTDCHEGSEGNNFYLVDNMEDVACIDCHMPKMGKNATSSNEFTGDLRGHLFQIMPDPITAAENVYDDNGKLFWNQDRFGESYVTLDYACLGCHIDIGEPLTMEEAFKASRRMHKPRPGLSERRTRRKKPGIGGSPSLKRP